MIEDYLQFISINLVILGGVIWGLLGITGYNFISRIARWSGIPDISRIVYIMIGVATLLFAQKYYPVPTVRDHLRKLFFGWLVDNEGFLPMPTTKEDRLKMELDLA